MELLNTSHAPADHDTWPADTGTAEQDDTSEERLDGHLQHSYNSAQAGHADEPENKKGARRHTHVSVKLLLLLLRPSHRLDWWQQVTQHKGTHAACSSQPVARRVFSILS